MKTNVIEKVYKGEIHRKVEGEWLRPVGFLYVKTPLQKTVEDWTEEEEAFWFEKYQLNF